MPRRLPTRNARSDDDDSDDDDNPTNESSLANVQARLAHVALADGEDHDEDEDDDDEFIEEGDGEDAVALLPPYVAQRVEKLKELHEKREEILIDYLAERAKLEQKFQELFKPLYKGRAEIIQGDKDEEIANEPATSGEGANEGDDGHDDAAGERVAGIPQFWVVAMGNMEVTADLITEEDVDCLEHLRDVTCVDDEDGKGFTLYFHFAPNDYFEDRILTKRYEVPNLLLSDEPILQNVTGCKIVWKAGRSLTFKEVKKKQRGKGKNAGQIRTVTKKERKESFFHFFETPKMPSMETMNEDEATQLEEFFDHDYDIAQAFRSHIIPKAVMWFTGQAMEEDMAQLEEGEEEGEEEGDRNQSGSNPFPPPVAGNDNPECQQS